MTLLTFAGVALAQYRIDTFQTTISSSAPVTFTVGGGSGTGSCSILANSTVTLGEVQIVVTGVALGGGATVATVNLTGATFVPNAERFIGADNPSTIQLVGSTTQLYAPRSAAGASSFGILNNGALLAPGTYVLKYFCGGARSM